MVEGLSVLISDLVMSFDVATNIVPPNTNQVPKLISANPGRNIMSIPTNPMMMEIQRPIFDGSFIMKMAPREAKTGIIKLMAVASARGITVNAQNQVIIEQA